MNKILIALLLAFSIAGCNSEPEIMIVNDKDDLREYKSILIEQEHVQSLINNRGIKSAFVQNKHVTYFYLKDGSILRCISGDGGAKWTIFNKPEAETK